jgi:hypothetical protein
MNPTKLLTLAVAIGIIGCSQRPSYKVYEVSDDFDEFEAFDLVENFVGGNEDFVSVQLNVSERLFPGQDPLYALRVVFEAPHRLNIKKGESLVLLVDGERMPFTSLRDSIADKAEGLGHVPNFEGKDFFATDDQPVRVASADEAAVLYVTNSPGRYGRYRHPGARRRYIRPSHPMLYRHYYPPYYNVYAQPYHPVPFYGIANPRVGRYHGYDPYAVWSYPHPYAYGAHPRDQYGYRHHPYGRPGYHDGAEYEEMIYPVSLDELRRIAQAEDVRIRIEGRFLIYRYFNQANFAIFQRFLEESASRQNGTAIAPG